MNQNDTPYTPEQDVELLKELDQLMPSLKPANGSFPSLLTPFETPSFQEASYNTNTMAKIPRPRQRSSSGPSSNDLVSKMASRLGQLEASQKKLRSRLVESEKEVLQLRQYQQVHRMTKETKDGNTLDISDVVSGLQHENAKLRNQVEEMKAFLEDYGLVWVGGEAGEMDRNINDETIHFPTFLDKLKQLNAIAEEQQQASFQAVKGTGSKVFQLQQKRSKVPLVVFKNGLYIKRGPLRPFTHPASKAFVADILDGYFPSEFKQEHPHGVIFDVTDRSAEVCDSSTTFKPFSGSGKAVGEKSRFSSLASVGGASLSMDLPEFLDSLPSAVVTSSGRVVSVRSDIQKFISGDEASRSSDNANMSDVPRDDRLPGSSKALANGSSNSNVPSNGSSSHVVANGEQITCLRIKSTSGQKTLALRIDASQTIKHLKALIDEYRTSSEPYQLRTIFPSKVLKDSDVLVEQGLFPNATLVIEKKLPA